LVAVFLWITQVILSVLGISVPDYNTPTIVAWFMTFAFGITGFFVFGVLFSQLAGSTTEYAAKHTKQFLFALTVFVSWRGALLLGPFLVTQGDIYLGTGIFVVGVVIDRLLNVFTDAQIGKPSPKPWDPGTFSW